MWQGNCFWKEAAGCSKDFSTLVGRMKVSVKLVTKKKAQKSTDSTIAQNGKGSAGRSQRLSEKGAKSENIEEGTEVAKRYCNAPSQ